MHFGPYKTPCEVDYPMPPGDLPDGGFGSEVDLEGLQARRPGRWRLPARSGRCLVLALSRAAPDPFERTARRHQLRALAELRSSTRRRCFLRAPLV